MVSIYEAINKRTWYTHVIKQDKGKKIKNKNYMMATEATGSL